MGSVALRSKASLQVSPSVRLANRRNLFRRKSQTVEKPYRELSEGPQPL